MFSSHNFKRTNYAVEIGERWFLIELCSCGQVHACRNFSSEPDKNIPRLPAEELNDEIRNHLTTSPFVIEELPEEEFTSNGK